MFIGDDMGLGGGKRGVKKKTIFIPECSIHVMMYSSATRGIDHSTSTNMDGCQKLLC